MTTHPPRTFERRNVGDRGITRIERESLINDVDEYLLTVAGDHRATKITVNVTVEAKGER